MEPKLKFDTVLKHEMTQFRTSGDVVAGVVINIEWVLIHGEWLWHFHFDIVAIQNGLVWDGESWDETLEGISIFSFQFRSEFIGNRVAQAETSSLDINVQFSRVEWLKLFDKDIYGSYVQN